MFNCSQTLAILEWNVTLQPSDAALLQAILFGCGSSSITLNSILNTSLSLGHELPTFLQFDGGLARLVAAGLISYETQRVRPTNEAIQIAEEIMCQQGSPELFLERLLEILLSRSLDREAGFYTLGELTPAEFDNAFA